MSSATIVLRNLVLSAACLALPPSVAAAQAAPSHAPVVKGTGGSSATRVLNRWSEEFAKEHGIRAEFAPANSDVGIAEMTARRVDFGSTEIPLTPEQLRKSGLMQFPMLVGGVVPVVNIPGVGPGALRLSSGVLARILLGEVQFWDSPEIRALNPSLNLPRLRIQIIVRATSASTTLALTTFLAKTDKNWATRIGAEKLPKWPAPTQAVQNVRLMAEKVESTPGAIGYINFDEAYGRKLSHVMLKNKSGNFVAASHESIRNATVTAGLGKSGDHVPELIDVGGAATWPIVEITYGLVDQNPKDTARSRSTLRFFYWAFLQGDRMAAETGFIPLSSSSQAKIVGRYREVVGPDGKPIDYMN